LFPHLCTPLWEHLSLLVLGGLALKFPQLAPMAVALGLVPVWYPNLALMPPQVAPMAVALGLVSALLWLNCPQ